MEGGPHGKRLKKRVKIVLPDTEIAQILHLVGMGKSVLDKALKTIVKVMMFFKKEFKSIL